MSKLFDKELGAIRHLPELRISGKVTQVIGGLIEANGPTAFVGEMCLIYGRKGDPIPCQVVGFKERKTLLMSFGDVPDITAGAEVYPTGEEHRIGVSLNMCGRILDGFGHPIDGGSKIVPEHFYPTKPTPLSPLERKPINAYLETQIRAIDGVCTLGRGGRVGIFSEAGVGKSSLLGTIAQRVKSDINVIALIGERGREVGEFLEHKLGKESLSRSVVIVVTADQSPLLKIRGADLAMTIAEYFRNLGKEVVFMMDSLSRYAMALRDIGLAAGEPPTTRGYTPSVFANLPKFLERAGNTFKGSITGLYTILCEEENGFDPLPGQIRSLTDGHLFLF